MKFTLRHPQFVALILFLAPFSTQTGLTKGAFVKVVITGPGIDGSLEITDPKMLEVFAFFKHPDRLMSRSPAFEPGVELGESYWIDRYLVENSVWDTLTYYQTQQAAKAISITMAVNMCQQTLPLVL